MGNNSSPPPPPPSRVIIWERRHVVAQSPKTAVCALLIQCSRLCVCVCVQMLTSIVINLYLFLVSSLARSFLLDFQRKTPEKCLKMFIHTLRGKQMEETTHAEGGWGEGTTSTLTHSNVLCHQPHQLTYSLSLHRIVLLASQHLQQSTRIVTMHNPELRPHNSDGTHSGVIL